MKKIDFLKKLFLLVCLVATNHFVGAQRVIQSGGKIVMGTNATILLQGVNIQNEGELDAQLGTIELSGAGSNSIGGAGVFQPIKNLIINKDAGGQVVMNSNLTVSEDVVLNSGNLDLTNKVLTLTQNSGKVINETATNRILASSGGSILATETINNTGLAVNIGNLGAEINTVSNMGLVTVTRRHGSLNLANANNKTLLRTYQITPQNNTGLNVDLKLNYFDLELNGITESELTNFKSENGTDFVNIGFTSKDATANTITKNGITSFSTFAVAAPSSNPLPLTLESFSTKCNNGFVGLEWKTSSEVNTKRFDIQRSAGTNEWKNIGSINSNVNSNELVAYNFVDFEANLHPENYYRFAMYDLDGKNSYSKTIASLGCKAEASLNAYPNPVVDFTQIAGENFKTSDATYEVFDIMGKKLHQKAKAMPANAILNLSSLPSGNYQIVIKQNSFENKVIKIAKL